MERNVQITFRDIEPSEFIEAQVEARIDELEQYFDHIVGCRVLIEAPHQSKTKGKLYNVKIFLDVPGDTIAVTHTHPNDGAHEEFEVALRDAFNAARRRLKDYVAKMRGNVKSHELPDVAEG